MHSQAPRLIGLHTCSQATKQQASPLPQKPFLILSVALIATSKYKGVAVSTKRTFYWLEIMLCGILRGNKMKNTQQTFQFSQVSEEKFYVANRTMLMKNKVKSGNSLCLAKYDVQY